MSCDLSAVLPQDNRLRHRRDFDAVYQRGFRRGSRCFTLRVLKKPEQPTQIGISISKKVSKRAVVRNRIKRQIRAILRNFLPRTKSGFSIVIGVRIEAVECDYSQYLQELEQLLVKAEVLNGS
ncbi:MAG: ribonuclease P protein component [Leptolyngbya sp. Prado105]|nr:ribonuclease P protein component [Leptolyngbya sp. Prado105]